MAFDLQKFLADELQFSPEQVAELAPKFTGDSATRLESRVQFQADYQKAKAEVDRTRGELDRTNQQLNAEVAEWAAIKNQDSQAALAKQREIEQLKADRAVLETRLSEMATTHGIDPKTVLLAAPAPVKPVEVPPVDPSKFVPREELAQAVGLLYNNPIEFQAIQADHFAVFGRPMTGDEIRALGKSTLERAAKKEPSDPRTVWEDTFKVGEAREKSRVDQYNADIKAAEDRGMERARSEQVLPTAHPTGSSAPIFKSGDGKSKLDRPQPGRNVLGYAAALREHKYANPVRVKTA